MQTQLDTIERSFERVFEALVYLHHQAEIRDELELSDDIRGLMIWVEACQSRLASRRSTQSLPTLPHAHGFVNPF